MEALQSLMKSSIKLLGTFLIVKYIFNLLASDDLEWIDVKRLRTILNQFRKKNEPETTTEEVDLTNPGKSIKKKLKKEIQDAATIKIKTEKEEGEAITIPSLKSLIVLGIRKIKNRMLDRKHKNYKYPSDKLIGDLTNEQRDPKLVIELEQKEYEPPEYPITLTDVILEYSDEHLDDQEDQVVN